MELKYAVGGLDLDSKVMGYISDDVLPHHRFIVGSLDHTASIFIARATSHPKVAEIFGLDEGTLVGGGSCYLDKDRFFIFYKYSRIYGAIPNVAAQNFGKLLIPRLVEQGIYVKGILTNTNEERLNKFWRENINY